MDTSFINQDLLKEYLPHLIYGALVILLFVVLRLIVYFASRKIRTKISKAQQPIYQFTVKFAATLIWALAFIFALSAWGVNIGALVTSLGLVTFSIGLALKDAITNALSGALILFYHPFKVNDHIKTVGVEGTVVNINMRYITVEDIQHSGEFHMIPNSRLLSEKVTLVKRPKSGM